MATDIATRPRPDAVRDLRDVLMAHQAMAPAGAGSSPVPGGNQEAESLARDIMALVQSEIDTQVEWRVQQAMERLRAEGLSGPAQQAVDTHHRGASAALSIPMMIFSIPIIAIAGGIGELPGLILALAALVVINLAWATGWAPGRQRRR
jgi:hypothetical protein